MFFSLIFPELLFSKYINEEEVEFGLQSPQVFYQDNLKNNLIFLSITTLDRTNSY